MAVASAQAGDLETAESAGLGALAVAQLTASGRIITELRRLHAVLNGVRSARTVPLRDALATVTRPPCTR